MAVVGEYLGVDRDQRVALAREQFFSGGPLPAGLVADTIERSWRRCAGRGLNAGGPPELAVVTARQLRERRDRSDMLVAVAQPELENLYQQIANTRSVVLLTDADATILTSIGTLSIEHPATRKYASPGACWAEEFMGTNAIGTALLEIRPLTVFGREHYFEQNGLFSCSAAPMFDPFGKLIGVLDISGGDAVRQKHVQSLAGMSARHIENRLMFAQLGMHTLARFHSRPEFLGTLWEAVAAFDADGGLVAANRAACSLLELDRQHLQQHDFAGLFDSTYDRFMGYFATSGRSPLLLHTHNGVRVYANARTPQAATQRGASLFSAAEAAGPTRTGGQLRLGDITLGDASMQLLLDKARRAFAAGIPVLLEGETGSGKEVLARALHLDSRRGAGPFVAINCASIPETLIEAELFGYREGAFTGARRGGAVGKLQQADKGTLFLDEIGDMPLMLQARLLRVLQEREVTPLGSGKVVPIDIAVICATHMNLRELVSQGRFREDLYYRLNGLRVELPPLRKRDNLRDIFTRVVQLKAGEGRAVSISEEVMDAFENHPWPGNMRQVTNVIATALALLGDDDRIELCHLTDDFLKEMIDRQSARSAPLPGAGTLAAMEAQAVRMAMQRHAGNISAAAAALGITRATLYRKIKQYGTL